MSPRAIDKRARPGNEDTPAPAGPALTPDFDPTEEVELPADDGELKDGAAG